MKIPIPRNERALKIPKGGISTGLQSPDLIDKGELPPSDAQLGAQVIDLTSLGDLEKVDLSGPEAPMLVAALSRILGSQHQE